MTVARGARCRRQVVGVDVFGVGEAESDSRLGERSEEAEEHERRTLWGDMVRRAEQEEVTRSSSAHLCVEACGQTRSPRHVRCWECSHGLDSIQF